MNKTELEINLGNYNGPCEGFSTWQKIVDPLYYDRPLEERVDVATSLDFEGGKGPDTIRRALAIGPLPSLAQSIRGYSCRSLLEAVAFQLGMAVAKYDAKRIPHDDRNTPHSMNSLGCFFTCDRRTNENSSDWRPLLKELVVNGADIQNMSVSTPFIELFDGLFWMTDRDERAKTVSKVPFMLDIWLSCLEESGVSLAGYGYLEKELGVFGNVYWGPHETCMEDMYWCLRIFTYGPSPSDWKVGIQLVDQWEEETESPQLMPGAWIDGDDCEPSESLSANEVAEVKCEYYLISVKGVERRMQSVVHPSDLRRLRALLIDPLAYS